MIRSLSGQIGVVAGLLVALLMGPAITAAPGPGNSAPLPKGWGWLLAAGTVSSVDLNARTATLAIAGQGRLETLEGGTTWRRHDVVGAQIVHVLPSTVMADAGGEVASLVAIRAGVPATVWAAVRPDTSILALKVLLTSTTPRPLPAQATALPGGVSGAVLRRAGGVLEVVTIQGARRSVILTGATAVRNASGASVPLSAIAPYDIVRVDGAVNSDGSVSATRIEVELEATSAWQVSGAVDLVIGEVGGLAIGGVMIPIPWACYFIKGSGPGAFKELAPGQTVTVYGTAIVAGTTPIGVRARVVAVR
jgi:hypothetical protein